MITHLSRNWWVLALRGVVAILFGILVFIFPGLSLQSLILVLAAYLLVDGISNVVSAFTNQQRYEQWWVLLLEGIVSIIAGIIAFIWPGVTVFVLLYVISAWAIVTGVLEVMAAIRLRKEIAGEWLLALSGVLSILFGIAVVLWPGAGILTVLGLIGGYAIFFGILMLALAIRLRGHGTDQPMSQSPAV